MNLALVYLWKEWRAQRGILLAYAGLMFGCLALGLSLAPTHTWFDEGFGVHALSWFVAAGVIGVVAFAVPALVRGEFGQKEDLFVRRLPGALAPAFAGKLLFLVLAGLLFPLVGLLLGEWFVQAHGSNWDGLFHWSWDGSVLVRWPAVLEGCAAALLLAPWIWAISTWTPGGRMAIGGTALFVLLIGVCVFAVFRQSPNLEQGLAWHSWLWAVPPLGLGVAWVSWCKGRRGGGPLRSARFGLAIAAIGFAPPAGWLANEAWHYHHPEPQRTTRLEVTGLSPDGRFALVRAAENENYVPVPFRVDLPTGAAEQLGSIYEAFAPELVRPNWLGMTGKQRYWQRYSMDLEREVYDLDTGTCTPMGKGQGAYDFVVPTDLRSVLVAQQKTTSTLRAPDGGVVWFEDGMLCHESSGGVARTPWSQDTALVWPAGHGFWASDRKGNRALFTADGRKVDVPCDDHAFVVRDQVLFVPRNGHGWWQKPVAGGTGREVLVGSYPIGLLDDDVLLCAARLTQKQNGVVLFTHDPASGAESAIAGVPDLCASSLDAVSALGRPAVLPRDAKGRLWLVASNGHGLTWLLVDAASRSVVRTLRAVGNRRWDRRLLDFGDGDTVLIQDGATIARWNTITDTRDVLFPRGRAHM